METKMLQIASADLQNENEEIEIIGINTICRLCATNNERLIGIFAEEGVSNDLSNKINLYLPIKVGVNDELPLQCCWNCASTLLAWHELVVTSVEVDRKFRSSHIIPQKQGNEAEELDNAANTSISDDNDGSCDSFETKETKSAQGLCTICQKTLSRPRDLKRHIATCHPADSVTNLRSKKCDKCPQVFETPSKLQEAHPNHAKRPRRKKTEISPKFFCDVCDKGFTRKHDMEKHKVKAHGSTIVKLKSSKNFAVLTKCRNRDSDGKVFYKCDFCDKNFAKSYHLIRHRGIHNDVREFFCHMCAKSFRMAASLNRHIDTFHNGVRNYSCEVCNKSFTARATRDEHMNIHTNNRPFVCDVCGKSFKQKASLHVHKMFHSDLYRFECDVCGKKFKRKQELKVHSWLHTGHRPYSCHKCKAAFRLKHDLNRHLKVHEKLGECVCNVCGCVFSQQRYLKVHRKIHENVEMVKADGGQQGQ